MGDRIERSDGGGMCTLLINRPEKMNALDTAFFEELDAELATLERETDRIGCVVLRGAGRCFSAGADLNAIGSKPVDPRYKSGVIERLATLPQPTVAAVHGVCFTGGLELALGCDFIVADTSARFADTHGKWGLVAAWGLIQRLPRRIGTQAAKRMMMTGGTIEAEAADALGLVDILAAEGALDDAVATLTRAILESSWHTNIATKRLLRETDGMSLAEGLAHENFRYPGPAPDRAERFARFAKK